MAMKQSVYSLIDLLAWRPRLPSNARRGGVPGDASSLSDHKSSRLSDESPINQAADSFAVT